MREKRPNPEFDAFTKLVDRMLLISHTEVLRRETKYQEEAAKNPRRRGPKRKLKPSSVGHAPNDKD
jgi:hypothetical protein